MQGQRHPCSNFKTSTIELPVCGTLRKNPVLGGHRDLKRPSILNRGHNHRSCKRFIKTLKTVPRNIPLLLTTGQFQNTSEFKLTSQAESFGAALDAWMRDTLISVQSLYKGTRKIQCLAFLIS